MLYRREVEDFGVFSECVLFCERDEDRRDDVEESYFEFLYCLDEFYEFKFGYCYDCIVMKCGDVSYEDDGIDM